MVYAFLSSSLFFLAVVSSEAMEPNNEGMLYGVLGFLAAVAALVGACLTVCCMGPTRRGFRVGGGLTAASVAALLYPMFATLASPRFRAVGIYWLILSALRVAVVALTWLAWPTLRADGHVSLPPFDDANDEGAGSLAAPSVHELRAVAAASGIVQQRPPHGK